MRGISEEIFGPLTQNGYRMSVARAGNAYRNFRGSTLE
jgi:hypothetical protein